MAEGDAERTAELMGAIAVLREPMGQLASALDVVVHASTRPEPFGLVVAEAMACGRAVIASRQSGAAEFVRDGDDVILSESNVEDLTRSLRRVVADADLRARLGGHARATALKYFDRQRMGGEIISVYRDVVRANT